MAVALVVGLAACRPIVVGPDGVESSHATMAASPVSVTVSGSSKAAIEVRLRDCHTVHFEGEGAPANDIHLRPVATVTAADGTILFANYSYAQGSYVAPPGSSVTDGGTSEAHRIVVPVAGAATPIKVAAGCTSYPGVGSIPNAPRWSFPLCTTSTRTCAATAPGQGTYAF